ncbi:unnamed protein product [Rotaria socialis]|uniref:EGF-like domain-containing protein n=1 Tax=Rotaria socialis TaxID=392032 RepID=A0A821CCA8_9BILA|nr:unnamed protein product [Rotaria socialis]
MCDWLPTTVTIHGFTCRSFSTLNNGQTIALGNAMLSEDGEKVINNGSLPDTDYGFRCTSEHKCIPMSVIRGDRPVCIGGEDMDLMSIGGTSKDSYLTFATLCDGFIDHMRTDSFNYTDETDCDNWLCDNVYSRCNGKWNCRNAIDEANCPYNPCRPNDHPCILSFSHNFICLPLSQINDGHIDCLGGYDELYRCGMNLEICGRRSHRCFNETKCVQPYERRGKLFGQCWSRDDQELWCRKLQNSSRPSQYDVDFQKPCDFDYHFTSINQVSSCVVIFFRPIYIEKSCDLSFYCGKICEYNCMTTTTTETSSSNLFDSESEYSFPELTDICYRGIPVYVNNFTESSCLCPSAYFGHICEKQNQRISLTLHFRTVEWRTVFTFVIMFVDEDINIHSWEQVDYLSVRDCRKKFNLYLLYSTRPKVTNQIYYVRIDTYHKEKLEYYITMIYPIRYSFLPVYRLALQVDVPIPAGAMNVKKCPLKCSHGQSKKFSNSDEYFCQCFDGYSGILCTIKNKCDYSSDSICIAVVNNRSLCICPLNKFGPRCYLKKTSCIAKSCPVNGRCIPGYGGSKCKDRVMKIELHFSRKLFIPQEYYYGSRCQFTTTGFGLSLDDIFGYDILPNVSFSRQPTVVKITTAFTIIILVLAIINGTLCITTFQTKRSLAIGTGFYLLLASITSLLTIILFALKFLFLLLSQISIVTIYHFLRSNCLFTNMLLTPFFAIEEWLNSCVSIERVLTVKLGIEFDKTKSKKAAKRVVLGLYLFVLASFIHDPFHRDLLEVTEEQRTWCIVFYSPSMKRYASFIHIFHFILPFFINSMSIVLLIILMAQKKSKSHQQKTYRKHLSEQFHQQKHRLLSSVVLVIIAIPRLIISFGSECMKSVQSPWLYLSGYFIPFMPPLLVFIIFVLPSEFYRKEFNEATLRIKKVLQSQFRRD